MDHFIRELVFELFSFYGIGSDIVSAIVVATYFVVAFVVKVIALVIIEAPISELKKVIFIKLAIQLCNFFSGQPPFLFDFFLLEPFSSSDFLLEAPLEVGVPVNRNKIHVEM